MLKNYWKTTLRHLKSIYSLINLLGLTVSLSVFVLIYVWVDDELSFDKFHEGHERIYRVIQDRLQPDGSFNSVALLPPMLHDYILANNKQVEEACRFSKMKLLLSHEEKAFYKQGISADPSFFKMFTFPLIEGDLSQFVGPDKIVLTASTAQTYFGSEKALGKTMKISSRDLTVVGVMQDVPTNSTLKFDFVFTIETSKQLGWVNLDVWNWSTHHLWIKLKPNESLSVFEATLKSLLQKNIKDSKDELHLQPLARIHLYSNGIDYDAPEWHGNIEYVYSFSTVAVFIILIACINYTNLATARSLKRAKEAGVRKVSGASPAQLMIQFFSESLIYALLAGILATGLAWLLWPTFQNLTGKPISFNGDVRWMGLIIVAVVLLCGILAGIYPALYLSRLKPTVVFKNAAKTGNRVITFRRVLVVVQFTLSLSFVAGTLIMYHQLQFIQNRDIGFNRNNIIVFRIPGKLQARYAELKSEIKKLAGVENITIVSQNMSAVSDAVSKVKWEGKPDQLNFDFHVIATDHDFVKTFDVQILQGRDYSVEIASDSTAYMLNEEAVTRMGIKNPVDKTYEIEGYKPGKIIGIIKDFNFESAQKKIEPLVIFISLIDAYDVSVRLRPGDIKNATDAIASVWKRFAPERPFEFSFLNEDLNKLYLTEHRTGQLFACLAILSIFVSCLGLLGIVMFTTEQRMKEVAVRKVMGASVTSVFFHISKEFFILILTANVIALPLAAYLMNKWLLKFAFADKVPVLIYIGTLLISFLVTLITIGFFALKSAQANPVVALKTE